MADFPALSTGCYTQIPWSFSRRFETSRNDQASGQRYSYANRSTAQRVWTVTYSDITDAEVATLKAFFDARGGKLQTFGFTDPETGTYYATCRFDSEFELRYTSANHNALTLVVQTVG